MYHDTTTIFVFGAILLTFVGLLQVWLWEQDRRSHELGLWGVAHLLGGFGLALLVGRGLLPNRLSIDLGNAAIDLGGGLAWIGVRRFERRPAPISVAFVGAICWLIACQFDNFHNSPADRAGFGAVILGTYDALCVCEFLRRHVGGDLPSRRALAIIFAIDTVMNSIRLTAAMLQSSGQPALNLPGSQWFGWPAMLGLVCVAGTSVLQIAVAKEAAEQRSNAILAEARDTAHRTNLAKSRFLARMSHELRTPLNGVLGMAQTLTRDPAIRGAQRERAVLLEQSGRHLLAIISDILDLASVESGQFQLAPRPTLVSDVVQGSVDLVAETASMKQMTLDVEHDADVPTAVLADPLRVRQILVNLLGNAIKFTPAGGRVALRVSRLALIGGVRLAVTDTGPGVAPEIRPHLFQDFVRRPMDAGTTEGTGLGLSISASLAEAMGGTIRYEPGPYGAGSRFVVELPLATTEPPPLQPVNVPPPRSPAGMLVLVVDDVVSNRRLAEALLQQAGFSVWLAADGVAALEALRHDLLPDVVLMDLHMPGMDGLTATRRIRGLEGRAGQVPVLALTADASTDRTQACLDAGMNGVVTKPIDITQLVDAIAAAAPPPLPEFSPADAVSLPSEPAMRPT